MLKLLFSLISFLSLACYAQQPWKGGKFPVISYSGPASQKPEDIQTDICGNNIDDDGNGLIDCQDYSCYFNTSASSCNCAPIDVIWVCTGQGQLYWINHQAGIERWVGTLGRVMTDITWTPSGKLYGVDWFENKIYEINPETAASIFVTNVSGYNASNAMTSDGDGNLFMASRRSATGGWDIIKVNIQTGQVQMVADLTANGANSGGDLAFSNGTLYLACLGNRVAKININTGAIVVSSINGLPAGAQIFGIVAKADGTLYLGDDNRLYQLNPTTMQATLHYTSSTQGMSIWGMSNFNDYCLAPACLARVNITIESNPPYCEVPGVTLKANGTGLINTSAYRWTLPNGTILSTPTVVATIPGQYKVRYHSLPDTCGWEDSITLPVISTPSVNLGRDTVLCIGTQITLSAPAAQDQVSYLWQDNSSSAQFTVTQPGVYWLEATNVCASVRDSIIITQASLPGVELGPDRESCRFDTIHLHNFLDAAGYEYEWMNNSSEKILVVDSAGYYWVDVSNICGTVRDSVRILNKVEGCECFMYVPTGFTPNNDGKNDQLRPHSNCAISGELTIYNRNGELVYSTKNLVRGWNGIFKSLRQPPGVFVYQLKYKYNSRPGTYYKKGTFVLIR